MFALHPYFENLAANELILDVRTQGEFLEGHVPNAKHIPVNQVVNHVSELGKFKTVYVYCHSGSRSTVACQMLETLGLSNLVCVNEGGFPDWEGAGFTCSSEIL